MLNNADIKCNIYGINFNYHKTGHIVRAALEAVAFSFVYGAEQMSKEGILIEKVRAGKGNLF